MDDLMLRAPSPGLFLSVTTARDALAKARTLLDAKKVKDAAAAMRVWAQAQEAGGEAQRQAAEIVLRAERRMGQILAAARKNGTRAGDGKPSQRVTVSKPTLAELGVKNRELASRYQKVASLPEEQFEAFVEAAKEEARELTTAAALRLANGGTLAAYASSESVEWYTPAKYVEAARVALGEIDLDPASSTKANKTVRASQIFTEKDDGLARPWAGRVWLNPPYAKDVTGLWTKKLADECEAGRVTSAILLVNAAPDREWFRDVWRSALVCFTDHRIHFVPGPGIDAKDAPVMGNTFAYWGPDEAAFCHTFAAFGTVVRKA